MGEWVIFILFINAGYILFLPLVVVSKNVSTIRADIYTN